MNRNNIEGFINGEENYVQITNRDFPVILDFLRRINIDRIITFVTLPEYAGKGEICFGIGMSGSYAKHPIYEIIEILEQGKKLYDLDTYIKYLETNNPDYKNKLIVNSETLEFKTVSAGILLQINAGLFSEWYRCDEIPKYFIENNIPVIFKDKKIFYKNIEIREYLPFSEELRDVFPDDLKIFTVGTRDYSSICLANDYHKKLSYNECLDSKPKNNKYFDIVRELDLHVKDNDGNSLFNHNELKFPCVIEFNERIGEQWSNEDEYNDIVLDIIQVATNEKEFNKIILSYKDLELPKENIILYCDDNDEDINKTLKDIGNKMKNQLPNSKICVKTIWHSSHNPDYEFNI